MSAGSVGMKSALLAGAILLASDIAHADPASHRSVAALLMQNEEWQPSWTVAPGSAALVVSQNLLDAARRDGLSPTDVARQILENDGDSCSASDMPDNPLAHARSTLYIELLVQDLWVLRTRGTVVHEYVTRHEGAQLVIPDFRPQPQQCRVMGPTS